MHIETLSIFSKSKQNTLQKRKFSKLKTERISNLITKTKNFQYFSKHRKQFHLLRINNAYETIYKKKKRKKKEKRKMKNSSLSESESKFERVISSFFTRETLLECTARNKAVTSVLNSLYSTRT